MNTLSVKEEKFIASLNKNIKPQKTLMIFELILAIGISLCFLSTFIPSIFNVIQEPDNLELMNMYPVGTGFIIVPIFAALRINSTMFMLSTIVWIFAVTYITNYKNNKQFLEITNKLTALQNEKIL